MVRTRQLYLQLIDQTQSVVRTKTRSTLGLMCCARPGMSRFLRSERRWFTPTHDAILLKKAFKVGAWAEINADGQISDRAKEKGFLPGWLMHLPEGVGKVGRRSLIEHGLDTIHKLKNASKIQVQQALGYDKASHQLLFHSPITLNSVNKSPLRVQRLQPQWASRCSSR